MDAIDRQIYDLLKERVARNQVCPSNDFIGQQLGVSEYAVKSSIYRLIGRKLIRVSSKGGRRVVHIGADSTKYPERNTDRIKAGNPRRWRQARRERLAKITGHKSWQVGIDGECGVWENLRFGIYY